MARNIGYKEQAITSGLIHHETKIADNSAYLEFGGWGRITSVGADNPNAGSVEYVEFHFYNIHPRTDDTKFQMGFSTNAYPDQAWQSNHHTKTSIVMYHAQGTNGSISFNFDPTELQANSTAMGVLLSKEMGNATEELAAGQLRLYRPNSHNPYKHYESIGTCVSYQQSAMSYWVNGYTSDNGKISLIRFQMASGNFDGKIACYVQRGPGGLSGNP